MYSHNWPSRLGDKVTECPLTEKNGNKSKKKVGEKWLQSGKNEKMGINIEKRKSEKKKENRHFIFSIRYSQYAVNFGNFALPIPNSV